MCQANSTARGKRCTPKLGSAGWGWTGTAIALAALYHYGPFDPADHKLWKTVSTSYAMCEALRLVAVWLLPLWWHARRGAFPPKDLKENFGNQVLSLVVSLYTLATLATVQLHWSRTIPFLFPTADARNIDILQHMTVVLGTYVIVDTSHLLRILFIAVHSTMHVNASHGTIECTCDANISADAAPATACYCCSELSTPLLNVRWILRWVAQYTGKAAPLALSLAFAVLFILSRVALYGALILDLVK
eukprot:11457-Heterococcus_DN1.PRE.1